MRYSRACLVALLLGLSFALGCASAHAASLDEALAHFTTDDFSETSAGIGAVALSGDPRAETIIRALQDGRLMFSAESKAVYVKDESGKLTNAATGEAIAGDAPADLDNVRINNRLRGAIDAALGGLTLLAGDPGTRFEAAQAVFKSRAANALPTLETALAKEQDPRVKRALAEARAAVILAGDKGSEEEKTCRRGHRPPARRPGRTRAPFQPSRRHLAGRHEGGNDDDRGDQEPACPVGSGAERLVWNLFGLGPAARRHRPRHHLRRHGRDQHGPWRDGHARRLCHLRRAGRDPRAQSGIVRLFARDRHSALVSVRRLPSAY